MWNYPKVLIISHYKLHPSISRSLTKLWKKKVRLIVLKTRYVRRISQRHHDLSHWLCNACEGVSSCVFQWIKLCPAASSPPHVLAAEIDSGCWKAGCRSRRSLAAFALLKWKKPEHKGTSYYYYTGYSLTSPESRELLSLDSMFSKESHCRFVLRNTKRENYHCIISTPLQKWNSSFSFLYKFGCFVNDH